MRIVHRQPEDEMPKCEFIFERALSFDSVVSFIEGRLQNGGGFAA